MSCRYDGCNRSKSQFLTKIISENNPEIIAFCPEFAAVRQAPRPKIMISAEGEMVDESGATVTNRYLKTFESLAGIARKFAPDMVILKEKSPSCGLKKIFVRDTGWQPGTGLFAAMLRNELKARFFNEEGEECL